VLTNFVKVFISRLINLEKLRINKLQHKKPLAINGRIVHFGVSSDIQKRSLNLGIMCYGSQKDRKHMLENSQGSGLAHIEYISIYQIILLF